MNLGDPELELIDPTPNVHSMFLHFDKLFFWTKLASRAVVRWSKRMYSCAGTCSYEGRGGLCSIALSEPLLKLRPRKDLVETLLHEMIHAFLFVTNSDQDRDGHGPNFKSHMHRINNIAGVNISIYHDFHDEVKLYRTHWWRCNGPCQMQKPYFGIVRRTVNKPPGPSDYWWKAHMRNCGGTYIKIKEPQKVEKKSNSKPTAAINNKKINTIDNYIDNKIPILKDSSNLPGKIKSNSASTLVIGKKPISFNPSIIKSTKSVAPFTGNGNIIDDKKKRKSVDVADTVRKVWVNKNFPNNDNIDDNKKKRKSVDVADTVRKVWVSKNFPNNDNIKDNKKKRKSVDVANFPITPSVPSEGKDIIKSNVKTITPIKQKSLNSHIDSPPSKVKKIDDYFVKKASSLLKDIYGEDFIVTKSDNGTKLVVEKAAEFVTCPICSKKVPNAHINKHLDECLNKDVIEELSQEDSKILTKSKDVVNSVPTTKPICDPFADDRHFDINKNMKFEIPKSVDLSFMNELMDSNSNQRSKAENTQDNILDTKNNCTQNDKNADVKIKIEPGTSREKIETTPVCPCCGKILDQSIDEHLEDCLSFFLSDNGFSEDKPSTSSANQIIVIDDDDDDPMFDESQIFNATGTKLPCPCCYNMFEQVDMNKHLDICLN